MSDLRTAAQQALEALTDFFNAYPHMAKGYTEDALTDLRAALAQQDEPCPNCASLEAQNTELDRKLAEMEQAEREACADIADAEASIEGIAQRVSAAIRARGKK